jgi:hypothetical protein
MAADSEGPWVLTTQNIEAELSYAYLHAVASLAGVICEGTGRHSDDAGVDATLRVKGALAEDSVLTSFTVDVQLKATTARPVEQAGQYLFALKMKNYHELRSIRTNIPKVLIVLYLPAETGGWLSHSPEALVMRRCAYWLSLRNAPEVDNEASRTVRIPTANVLSSDQLRALLTRFSRREVIDYVE